MSEKSLQLLKALFAENSTVNVPIGLAEQILEIREWVGEELENIRKEPS